MQFSKSTLFIGGGIIVAVILIGTLSSNTPNNNETIVSEPVLTGPFTDPFQKGVFSSQLRGGYVDSHFLSHDGMSYYFMYTPWTVSEMMSISPPGTCPKGPALEGHNTAEGLEWNTDLYVMKWEGTRWSAPKNLGPNINSLALECCVWVSDDETEMVFGRASDFDGDGKGGDLGLPVSGEYGSTRHNKDSPWVKAVAMEGKYGPLGTGKVGSINLQVTDLLKTPSKNIYGWETNAEGKDRLIFGKWNGTGNDAPVVIPGSEHADTQVWVSNDELTMLYNHREENSNTTLRKMTRTSVNEPWSAPVTVPTKGFEDSKGATVWGEPTFTADGSSMLFVRFNTTNPKCWASEIMRVKGNFVDGYSAPELLN